jgi:hypothetical protein
MSNPILMAELAPQRLRGGVNRLQWVYVALLLAELAACLVVSFKAHLQTELTSRATPWQGAIWTFYNLFFVQQVVAVTLLAPIFAAGSFTREKSLGTLELLLTTPLTDGEIVAGKWLAHLCQAVRWTLPGWLLLAFFQGLLGLSGWTLALWLAGTLVWAAAATSVALVCSALARRVIVALGFSYVILAAMLLSLFGFADLASLVPWDELTLADSWRSTSVATLLATACVPLAVLSVSLRRLIRWHLSGMKSVLTTRRLAVPSVGDEPIRWKHRWFGAAMGQGGIRALPRRGRAVLGAVALLLFCAAFTPSALALLAALLFVLLALPFAAAMLGSASIAPEREKNTWDAVRLAQLDPNEIVDQLRSAIVDALRFPWLFGFLAVAAMVLRLSAGWSWTAATGLAIILFGAWGLNLFTAPLAAVSGIRNSARSSTFWRSLVPTLLECAGYAALLVLAFLAVAIVAIVPCVILLAAANCSGSDTIYEAALAIYFAVTVFGVFQYQSRITNQIIDVQLAEAAEALRAINCHELELDTRHRPRTANHE